jgi:hypothetical protein
MNNKFLMDDNKLSKEWNHKKNSLIDIQKVTLGSHKKVWWTCPNGHNYESAVKNRTYGKSNCPYCAGKKASKDNNLKTRFPKVTKQWNFKKNKSNPEDYTYASNKKVWWQCSNGHEWLATIANIVRGSNCPMCSKGKKLTIKDMENIARERGGKSLSEEYINSQSHIKWQCKEGHIWNARPSNVKRGSWCPICAMK